MAAYNSAHVDAVALEAARAIMDLAVRDFPGGDVQRQAAIQCAVIEAIRQCLHHASHLIEIPPARFTRA